MEGRAHGLEATLADLRDLGIHDEIQPELVGGSGHRHHTPLGLPIHIAVDLTARLRPLDVGGDTTEGGQRQGTCQRGLGLDQGADIECFERKIVIHTLKCRGPHPPGKQVPGSHRPDRATISLGSHGIIRG